MHFLRVGNCYKIYFVKKDDILKKKIVLTIW